MSFSLEALGQVIRDNRERVGLTQDELGNRAGYGAGAGVSISRIENGLTRPSPDRFAGIAHALELTPGQLEAEAAAKTPADAGGAAPTGSEERLKDRIRRLQNEIERRTNVITGLGEDFNRAHDRARDEFFMRFVEIADRIEGAPKPDPRLLDDEDVTDPHQAAAFRIRVTTHGIATALAGGAGGAAAGAAVGGAAAYGAFMAAVSFGTASTGAAISGLSGAAATNAALALLGGGTLAAGGAGVAGGTMLLTGIVAAPALILAVGGLVWMVKRNRRQQQELAARLVEAEAEMTASRRGFDALADILPRATATLEYIAVHAGHALSRWDTQLDRETTEWDALSVDEQQRYQEFVSIAASQLSIVTINVQDLMSARGDEREKLIEFADEVLTQSRAVVEELV